MSHLNESSTTDSKELDSSITLKEVISIIQKLSATRQSTEISSIVSACSRRLTGAHGATFVLRDRDLCYYVGRKQLNV